MGTELKRSESEILTLVKEIEAYSDEGPEEGHMEADRILLRIIGDQRITDAFDKLSKWYA